MRSAIWHASWPRVVRPLRPLPLPLPLRPPDARARFCGGGFSQPRAASHFESVGRNLGASAQRTHSVAAAMTSSAGASRSAAANARRASASSLSAHGRVHARRSSRNSLSWAAEPCLLSLPAAARPSYGARATAAGGDERAPSRVSLSPAL
jgi:hypothetical protein